MMLLGSEVAGAGDDEFVVSAADVVAALMRRTRLTWWLCPPPVAVTVSVTCPMGAVAEIGTVSVES